MSGRYRDGLGAKTGLIAASGLALLFLPLLDNGQTFLRSYFCAAVLALSICFGAQVLLVAGHVVRGWWRAVLDAELRATAAMTPVAAILFLPLLAFLPELYSWVGQPAAALPEIVRKKLLYLDETFLAARSLVTLAIWAGLGLWLASMPAWRGPMQRGAAALAAIFLALSGTVATFDWILALEPKVVFADFGLIWMTGGAGAAAAVAALAGLARRPQEKWGSVLSEANLIGIGTILLALALLWAYLMAAHYIVVQSGDLPHHAKWYLDRIEGAWNVAIWLAVPLHVVLPFAFLLLPRGRARPGIVAAGAASLLAGHILYSAWQIAPAWHPGPGIWWPLLSVFGFAVVSVAIFRILVARLDVAREGTHEQA